MKTEANTTFDPRPALRSGPLADAALDAVQGGMRHGLAGVTTGIALSRAMPRPPCASDAVRVLR